MRVRKRRAAQDESLQFSCPCSCRIFPLGHKNQGSDFQQIPRHRCSMTASKRNWKHCRQKIVSYKAKSRAKEQMSQDLWVYLIHYGCLSVWKSKKDVSSYRKLKDARNSHLSLQLKQPLCHQMEHADMDGNDTEEQRLWAANCGRAHDAATWCLVWCHCFQAVECGVWRGGHPVMPWLKRFWTCVLACRFRHKFVHRSVITPSETWFAFLLLLSYLAWGRLKPHQITEHYPFCSVILPGLSSRLPLTVHLCSEGTFHPITVSKGTNAES